MTIYEWKNKEDKMKYGEWGEEAGDGMNLQKNKYETNK